MNLRILRIELRRSVAPWAGAVVLATALAYLYLVSGPWWRGAALWTAQWTSMALWTRYLLAFGWPLAVGLGALQGLRDPRSGMSELLASTPRPARHRAVALAGAMACTLVAAYVLLVLQGALRVLAGGAPDTSLGWLPISLVAALALAAGGALGMGAARALPSALTPPALAVAAFVLVNVLRQSSDEAVPTPVAVPNRLSLLSPTVSQVRETLLTLSLPVHLGQTLWLLGMGATGLALLAAATPRARLLALGPLLAGGAVALLLFPAQPRDTYVLDRAAAAPVCDGPVCVSTAQRARLAGLAGPGQDALRLLHGVLGDRAPVAVRESTAPRALDGTPEHSPDVLLVDFGDPVIGGATGERLTRVLVGQGLAPGCDPRSDTEVGSAHENAAQSIAAAWALGTDLRPLDGTRYSASEQDAVARPVWEGLRVLPAAEQRLRIDAMHAAALSCSGDPLAALSGGASR